MNARAGVSSTTISNKVQLSPETFERTGGEGWEGEGGKQNVEDTGKGVTELGWKVPRVVERKRNRER